MDLLRFVTTGSVDDGKSTLIGRLLYDSKSIYEDQLEAIEKTSEDKGYGYTNLALLTDGLRSEREQGITIDVAYRYFSTRRRKFIIADTPGHIQYTRNMVTGASTADLALLLVDARQGIVEQTRRHSLIASLLGIKHLVLCINKMDMVEYSQDVYEKIRADYEQFAAKIEINDIHFIPLSALNGDNVVNRSKNMDWFQGPTLLYTLENIHIGSDQNLVDCRLPVQYVIRPYDDEFHDFRGYSGRIESGIFKVGDEVVAMQSGFSSKIKSIESADGKIETARPPMSVVITLEGDIDISRGDMLVRPHNQTLKGQELEMMVCWLNDKKLVPGGKYYLKHTSREARCVVKEVRYKININTLHRVEGDSTVGMNDIARIQVGTSAPIFFDSYKKNRATGSAILIDEFTNETVGACMIL
jgi:sulfate adenylyltransferase subunit 1